MPKLIIDDNAFTPLMKVTYPDTSDYLIEKGGAGSGKSERTAYKILLRSMMETPHRFVCWRKVGKSLRNSTFKLLKDQIKRHGLDRIFDIKETDMMIVNRLNGNEIMNLGLDDREKVKSLTSPTGFWAEEITEFDEDDFNQLDTRLRGYTQHYKQFIGTFNPIDEHHWVKRRFFPEHVEQELKKKGWARDVKEIEIDDEVEKITTLVVHSTYKDNQFLPRKDRAKLEAYKDIDEQHYKIYALGEWGAIGNLIYTNFTFVNEYPLSYDEVIYGLDFGFNNPTALVKVGIRDQEYYIEELFYEKGYTNTQLLEEMLKLDIPDGSVIYADCAEPARIKELNDGFSIAGKTVDVLPADKSVKDGIDFVKSQKVHLHKNSVNLSRELKSYKWKETSDGKVIDGEPVKLNDHALDATRYAMYTYSLSPELKMAFL